MEDIKEFLINHHERLQEETASYEQQYRKMLEQEDTIFHPDITEQYRNLINGILSSEIAQNTTANPEQVMEFLESFDALAFIR